ncbi:proton-coupled zinc antiporter SLC30A1 [Salminus brasiliensis]|uniref:proton-coupled zinc antiporter SLC30A1 n=1 Tax=Salminus brasiliensis TaxID=930266 RepID=UPI003B83909F
MERSALWGSSAHRCLLAFTSTLLLCEIVVGRLCNSLINMVDSFHTLYILIHLTLQPLENADPSTSPDLSPRSVPQDPTPATADGPTVTDSVPLPSPRTTQPELNTVTGAAATASLASKQDQYSYLRVQPFGAVLSALLLSSLCVSISLQVISSTIQPLVIKRPLLATVVGAVSLLFNSVMLIWRGGREVDVGAGGLCKDLTETQNEEFATSDKKAMDKKQLRRRTSSDVEKRGRPDQPSLEGSRFHGDVLMFCNPGIPSVLNPEQHPKEGCSSSLSPPEAPTDPTTRSPPQSNHAENSISQNSADQQTLQLTETLKEVANCSACVGRTGWRDQVDSRPKRGKMASMGGIIAVIRSLLSSALVLVNGLTLLLSSGDCLQPRPACRLLPYLDPAFSVVTVLMLIVTTLPELCRHALVLLQATPAHMRVEELKASIGCVPGVLAVHELHVWQLSETHLVASVHVHCPSGLGAVACSEVLVTVKEVLNRFGVSYCTVQPEFFTTHSSDTQAGSEVADTVDAAVKPHCSLQCGKECAKKMCCSPTQVPPCTRAPATADMVVRQQDIVLENPYLSD